MASGMTLSEAVEYIHDDEAYVAALAELAEVREHLGWLLNSRGAYLFHEEECPWNHGPDDSCNCRVQRARALCARLEIK